MYFSQPAQDHMLCQAFPQFLLLFIAVDERDHDE